VQLIVIPLAISLVITTVLRFIVKFEPGKALDLGVGVAGAVLLVQLIFMGLRAWKDDGENGPRKGA
jgi:hypothetical protein